MNLVFKMALSPHPCPSPGGRGKKRTFSLREKVAEGRMRGKVAEM